jgi:hypothetical protein
MTYWERIGVEPYVEFDHYKYCACGKRAVQSSTTVDKEGYPLYLCDEHKQEGMVIQYKIPLPWPTYL